jgi:hypothetical protein
VVSGGAVRWRGHHLAVCGVGGGKARGGGEVDVGRELEAKREA